jgi:glutamine synthetase
MIVVPDPDTFLMFPNEKDEARFIGEIHELLVTFMPKPFSDDVIKKAIGKEAVDLFVEYKQKEWQHYIADTTELEYRLYFHC